MKPLDKSVLHCIKCPPNRGHNSNKEYLRKNKNITHKDYRHRPHNI